ncbi:ParB/RepB/Spo0J family partition protein [Terriglobus albidus]|uniref:ParB/RepB/Spo0J family partition protein n=1 Tax=Terriglobus albidus TaxID=1592106 RepID=UPI0021E048C4|nr:ParB/RepB/Spo0J family partition protein [Terriglobus albidus]
MSTGAKRAALGKGLEALLPSKKPAAEPVAPPPAAAAPVTVIEGKPKEIPVEAIERNPYQTRTRFDETALAELSASIAELGVAQPILVRPLPGGKFQLIAGERRWLASQRAGKTTVPAIIKEVSNEQAMEITIVENLQRADLNPMEQAKAYQRLSSEFGLTQEQMAKRTGKDRASVANFLRLLKLPESVQARVEVGEISFGHARSLLALEDVQLIEKAALKVVQMGMSVRATETFVQNQLNPERKLGKVEAVEDPPMDPNVKEAQTKLQRTLGLKVRIEDKNGKGKVVIEYANVDDFDRLLEALA